MTMNKLWILRPLNPEGGPWDPWYDKAFGFVVCAADEAQARQLASDSGGGETTPTYCKPPHLRPWLDPALSSCIELAPTETAGVLMNDFWAA